ncbi:unnamed protein product [Ectocarpus sp. 12 AP-2014]
MSTCKGPFHGITLPGCTYYTIEEMDASFTGNYLIFLDRHGRNQVWGKVIDAAAPQPWNGGHSYQLATSFRDLHAVPTQGFPTPIAAPVITHGASPTQAGPSVIGFRYTYAKHVHALHMGQISTKNLEATYSKRLFRRSSFEIPQSTSTGTKPMSVQRRYKVCCLLSSCSGDEATISRHLRATTEKIQLRRSARWCRWRRWNRTRCNSSTRHHQAPKLAHERIGRLCNGRRQGRRRRWRRCSGRKGGRW